MLPEVQFEIRTSYSVREVNDRIRTAFSKRDPLEEYGLSLRGAGYYVYRRERDGTFHIQHHLTNSMIVRLEAEAIQNQSGTVVMGRAWFMQPSGAGIIFLGAIATIIAGVGFGVPGALLTANSTGLVLLWAYYQSWIMARRLRMVLLRMPKA